MDDAEAIKLGFQFARDLANQLITLSTGILLLTITFMKDVLKIIPPKGVRALRIAWAIYLSSVIFGIWTIMALTGTLLDEESCKVIAFNVRFPSTLQIFSFLIATFLIIRFGYSSLKSLADRMSATSTEVANNPVNPSGG